MFIAVHADKGSCGVVLSLTRLLAARIGCCRCLLFLNVIIACAAIRGNVDFTQMTFHCIANSNPCCGCNPACVTTILQYYWTEIKSFNTMRISLPQASFVWLLVNDQLGPNWCKRCCVYINTSDF